MLYFYYSAVVLTFLFEPGVDMVLELIYESHSHSLSLSLFSKKVGRIRIVRWDRQQWLLED